jgi:hypothetical protein
MKENLKLFWSVFILHPFLKICYLPCTRYKRSFNLYPGHCP